MALPLKLVQIINSECNHTLQLVDIVWRQAASGHSTIPIDFICKHIEIAFPGATTVEGSGRLTLHQASAHFGEILDLELTVIRRDLAWMSKGKFISRNLLP